MKYVGERMADSGVENRDPTLFQTDCMFLRRFDVYPGVWKYRYRVGFNNWSIYDRRVETGE